LPCDYSIGSAVTAKLATVRGRDRRRD